MQSLINANLLRNFAVAVKGRVRLQIRLDLQNVQNRRGSRTPCTDPASTQFGEVSEHSLSVNRFLDVQAGIQF
jgi:hypothetical protein